MPEEALGARIAKRRHVLGLKQWQVAERVGVARDTVSMWERGLQFPHRHIGKLEEVLGIRLDSEPEVVVPLNDFERELLALRDDLAPGVAEELVRKSREQARAARKRAG